MRLLAKILLGIVVLVVLVVAGGLAYLQTAYPNVGPAANITVTASPELVERGAYLANHVAVCIDCHSTRDWNFYAGPPTPGTEGKGGDRFGEEMGFPGTYYAKNITPHNLGSWTDGEILRAIQSGVSRDGEPFFPVMPYLAYGKMAEEDARAIVAYLRTLPAIEATSPKSEPSFPMNFILRTIPKPPLPTAIPDKADTVAYGRYLTTVAACGDCHTPMVKGEPVAGMEFAGGMNFDFPFGTVRSLNITPDEETGIGAWDRESFIQLFKGYDGPEGRQIPVPPGEFNTPMPWSMYAGMTEEDLGAIFTFLQTLKPVKNQVERFTPKGQQISAP